jgi:hypothetical protein
MAYKDVDGNPLDDSSVTMETYTLPDGSTTDTRYYSQGIMDGAELDGQDFVVATLSSADGDYCVSADAPPATIPFTDDLTQSRGAMTRTDSTNGGLFADVPADFVCLNQGGHKPTGAQSAADPCLAGAADVGAGDISCHTLIDPVLPYGADYTCPYDPTSPPNTIYTVSGQFHVYPSTFTTELGHWNAGLWNGSSVDTSELTSLVHTDDLTASPVSWSNVELEVNTSQSYGNCTIGNYTTLISSTPNPDYEFYYNSYTCDVYDWPDDGITGWIGNILSSSVQSDVHCQTPVNLTINSDTTAPTFYCMQGDEFYISGNITDNSGDNISAITVDATSTSYDFDPTCTIADDFASYKCRVVVWTNAGISTPTAPHTTWNGTVRFTSTKTVCHDADAATPGVDPTTTSDATSYDNVTKTATYTGIAIGDHINEDIALKNNYAQCTSSYP